MNINRRGYIIIAIVLFAIVAMEILDSSFMKYHWFDKVNNRDYKLNNIIISVEEYWYPEIDHDSFLYRIFNYVYPNGDSENSVAFLKYQCSTSNLCKISIQSINEDIKDKLLVKITSKEADIFKNTELFYLKSWKSKNGEIKHMLYSKKYNLLINTTSKEFLSQIRFSKKT